MIDTSDRLRTKYFRPYLPGRGPVFRLTLWATSARDWRGQTVIAYRFESKEVGAKSYSVLFEGSDFAGSPMNADDSDSTLYGLLGFLTCKPGDTDSEYFADYTEAQMAFAQAHAETIACMIPEGF